MNFISLSGNVSTVWVETTLLVRHTLDCLQYKCLSPRNVIRTRKETNNIYFHLSLRKSQNSWRRGVLCFHKNTFYIKTQLQNKQIKLLALEKFILIRPVTYLLTLPVSDYDNSVWPITHTSEKCCLSSWKWIKNLFPYCQMHSMLDE